MHQWGLMSTLRFGGTASRSEQVSQLHRRPLQILMSASSNAMLSRPLSALQQSSTPATAPVFFLLALALFSFPLKLKQLIPQMTNSLASMSKVLM